MSTPTPALAARGRQFLSVLAASTAALAGVVAGLLLLQFQQIQDIEASARLRADSITALTFQFEREFLRLRHAVDSSLKTPEAQRDTDALTLRFDIFVSRTALLQDNPSTDLIREREEYQHLVPELTDLVRVGEDIWSQTPFTWARLPEFLRRMDNLGPPVQALSFASNAVMTALIEQKQRTIKEQYHIILWLTLAQLGLLLVVAVALWVRNQRMVRERLELERLADDLREARHKAETANQGKTRFLANMSHELRTPFNGLLGMLSLLEGTRLNAQQHDYTRTARESAQHLLTLLNDVLDVSAMEAGRLKLQPQPVCLAQLLLDVEQLMRAQAHSKGLELHIHAQPGLPEWVQTDPTRLKQILFNLLSNGIKFTPQGQVSLRVEPQRQAYLVANVSFVVEDTGIGMDDKAVAQLFQRFYQAESDNRRRFGGTGLGLEISRALARMMGGDLSATSRLGTGSVFTLNLPLPVTQQPPSAQDTGALNLPVTAMATTASGAVAAAPEPALPTATAQPPVAHARHGLWSGCRVLVAEDHPVNRKLVAALLNNLGCESVFCENGQLAVEAIDTQRFDLVLMDIHMPVMDGLEASRQIRQRFPNPSHLPIIALSADVMNDARDNALQAGINEFLPKPVRLPELKKTMAHLLRQKQTVLETLSAAVQDTAVVVAAQPLH